ncbi:MAG: HAD family hydrolase [Candidatus Ozemobacteraceae bacterium]
MIERPRAVFLDRDGTLNPDPGYIRRPEDFFLFPGVGEYLFRLKKAGFLLILVTNQSGIARGLIPPRSLCNIHHKLQSELLKSGTSLDRIYVCPHHPDFPPAQIDNAECGCRKPSPGLILKAIADLHIDPAKSFMVGDRDIDALMGIAAGVFPIVITRSFPKSLEGKNCHLAPTLEAAVDFILNHSDKKTQTK